MANYKDEENFELSNKGNNAFGPFNVYGNHQVQNQQGQDQQDQNQQQENNDKKDKKKDKACNVKKNKNKKCKKKHGFLFATGAIALAGIVGTIGYGHIKNIKQRDDDNKYVKEYLDSRQSRMEDMIDKGTAIDEMFKNNYKDLYEQYLFAYTIANYADKIDNMNLEHDIKEVDLANESYVNFSSPNYQEQIDALIKKYWELKNTRESQTIGSAEYIQFQRICNTLENTRAAADNIISSAEVTDIKYNIYSVCLVGDYVSRNYDKDGKPFDAAKIDGIKIVENGNQWDLVFDYNGYEYTKFNIPVEEIKNVLLLTTDRLSGFSTINSVLIGDKNDVSKGIVDEISDDLYNTTGVRISM